MAQMLLVNPRKRRRRKASTKARKTRVRRRRRAAPRAARVTRVRRRRNPIRARRTRSRRRRNPISLNVNSVKNQVMESAVGAAGAVALDVALGYLPIPAQFKTGAVGPLVKGAAAIALGMLAANVVKSSTAAKMTQGALTVMLHGIFRSTVGTYLPNVQFGDYDSGWNMDDSSLSSYYGSGWNPGVNEYLPDVSDSGVGAYAQADGDFAGY